MPRTLSMRTMPRAVIIALLALLGAVAALLPAAARAASTTASISLGNPIVSPGIGDFGRYNISIFNSGNPGTFPFSNTPAGQYERAHCVEIDQYAGAGGGVLNDEGSLALRNDANGATGNARMKWLMLSDYHADDTAPNATARTNGLAAHQSAIWALTNPTAALGNVANVRDPGNATAFQQAKDLYAVVSGAGFSPSWVNQAPAIAATGGNLCAGAKRQVTLTGAAFSTVTVSVPAGATVFVGGVDKGQQAVVTLDAQGTATVEVSKATAGDVEVTASFQNPMLVQARNGPDNTNQDFVYLRFQTVTKKVTLTFLNCQDLTVSKTAVPAYVRTFAWDVAKTAGVDGPITTTADQVTVPYTVTVTHTGGTDSNFTVAGQITVSNPNAFAVDNVDVSDQIQGGPACPVENGADRTIPAGEQLVLNYTCTLAAKTDGTNVASVSWNRPGLTPGVATGSKAFAFGEPTEILNGTLWVTDTAPEFAAKYGNPAVVQYTDPSPKVFTYERVLDVPTGQNACVVYDNVAKIAYPPTGEPFDQAAASVTVCRESQNLTVAKTATTTYSRTYDWTITKAAAPVTQTVAGDTATVTYTVVATKGAAVDSGFAVSGQITVSNPNPFPVTGVTVTDALPGATCQVTNGDNVTVPARTGEVPGTATVAYTCTRPDKVDGTNTATVTWSWTPQQAEALAAAAGPQTATGTAAVVFGAPATVTNDAVDVVDAFNGGAPQTLATGLTESRTFTSSRQLAVPAGGGQCATYPNVASVVNGTFRRDAAAEATVCREVTPPPPVTPVTPAGTPTTPVTPAGTPTRPVRPVTRARLSVTKRAPARATAGQVVPYTITVRNRGRATARGVVITDTLPAQTSLARRATGARLAGGALGWLVGAWDEVTWAFADLDLAPDVERGRFPGRVMVQNRALMLAIAGSGPRAALQPARAA